ncbi:MULTISPECIES: SSI family serine proteinase inhibitor [unclassified Streptomyces]|uniref:SSI family serine proteinase inhibitor n=1 Tax=unclassified Streptomyces TaxID=2593676 RepID=UPI002E2CFD6E|nr:SSI family serine proteinase inhibitor [Streptomyces sp. NBC_01429]
MPVRTALVAALLLTVTAPVTAASATSPAPVDHLTVTVAHSGSARTDGTFELYCHPGGGDHRAVQDACDALDGMTKWGQDTFAPPPGRAKCTAQDGGPATARVTGVWAARAVDARFRRTNGCEVSRWDRFKPLLPTPFSRPGAPAGSGWRLLGGATSGGAGSDGAGSGSAASGGVE